MEMEREWEKLKEREGKYVKGEGERANQHSSMEIVSRMTY